jgi:hypothetical protein
MLLLRLFEGLVKLLYHSNEFQTPRRFDQRDVRNLNEYKMDMGHCCVDQGSLDGQYGFP